jgi:hypothetical protein
MNIGNYRSIDFGAILNTLLLYKIVYQKTVVQNLSNFINNPNILRWVPYLIILWSTLDSD